MEAVAAKGKQRNDRNGYYGGICYGRSSSRKAGKVLEDGQGRGTCHIGSQRGGALKRLGEDRLLSKRRETAVFSSLI